MPPFHLAVAALAILQNAATTAAVGTTVEESCDPRWPLDEAPPADVTEPARSLTFGKCITHADCEEYGGVYSVSAHCKSRKVNTLIEDDHMPYGRWAKNYIAADDLETSARNHGIAFGFCSADCLSCRDEAKDHHIGIDGTCGACENHPIYASMLDLSTWKNITDVADVSMDPALTYIDLSDNTLGDNICNVTWPEGLLSLSIRNARITNITCLLAALPPGLQRLDLGENRIGNIERKYPWPEKLVKLGLSSNRLSGDLVDALGPDLPGGLKLLYAGGSPKITSLTRLPMPASLTYFTLSTNIGLRSIAVQQWPPGLKVLSLGGVPLNDTELSTVVNALPSTLRELWLHGNSEMTKVPENLPAQLHRLDLETTGISTLAGVTSWPEDLRTLFASSVRSHEDEAGCFDFAGTFPNLEYLEVLDLAGSSMRSCPDPYTGEYRYPQYAVWQIKTHVGNRGYKFLPPHHTAVADRNTFPKFQFDVFSPGPSFALGTGEQWPQWGWYHMDLSFDGLEEIPDGHTFPASVARISLQNNRITRVGKGVVWPCNALRILLNNNQIENIDDQHWPNRGTMNSLSLNDNKIKSIDGQDWPDSLTNLLLGNNEIYSIAGQRWPAGLTALTLSNNRINALTSQQWPVGLTEIDLSDNEIAAIETSSRWPVGLTKLLLSNNLIGSSALPMLFANPEDWHALEELDASKNRIDAVQSVTWPGNLTNINLDSNFLASMPESVDIGSPWPENLVELSVNYNPWSSILEENFLLGAGSIVDVLHANLPCGLETFNAETAAGLWTCSSGDGYPPAFDDLVVQGTVDEVAAADTDADSDLNTTTTQSSTTTTTKTLTTTATSSTTTPAVCPTSASSSAGDDVPLPPPPMRWHLCQLTDIGERVVQASQSYRDYFLDQSSDVYTSTVLVIVPILSAVLPLPLAWWQHRRGTFNLPLCIVLGASVFDVGMDWSFFSLEVSSEGFETSYNCTVEEPVVVCDATDGFYTCDGFADLHDKCAGRTGMYDGAAMARPEGGPSYPPRPGADSACECEGLRCGGPGLVTLDNGYNYSMSDLKCYERYRAAGYEHRNLIVTESEAGFCTEMKGYDDYMNHTCGIVNRDNPNATGTNECECRGHTCGAVAGTGGTCSDWVLKDRSGSYEAYRRSCLALLIVASGMQLVVWYTIIREEASVVPGSRPWLSFYSVSRRSTWAQVGLHVAVMLIEDVAQLTFQMVYFAVMGVANSPVALTSVATTSIMITVSVVSLTVTLVRGVGVDSNQISDPKAAVAEFF